MCKMSFFLCSISFSFIYLAFNSAVATPPPPLFPVFGCVLEYLVIHLPPYVLFISRLNTILFSSLSQLASEWSGYVYCYKPAQDEAVGHRFFFFFVNLTPPFRRSSTKPNLGDPEFAPVTFTIACAPVETGWSRLLA